MIWSLPELSAWPQADVATVRWCSHQAPLLQPAPLNFTGVALAPLLDTLDPDQHFAFARAHGADGFSCLLPRHACHGALIALHHNNAPLTADDGAPARLIAPGYAGFKQVKWLERLELLEHPSGGTWETRGAAVDAPLLAQARLTQARGFGHQLDLAGLAVWPDGMETPQISVNIDDHYSLAFAVTGLSRPLDGGLRLGAWEGTWRAPYQGRFALKLRLSIGGEPHGQSTAHTVDLT